MSYKKLLYMSFIFLFCHVLISSQVGMFGYVSIDTIVSIVTVLYGSHDVVSNDIVHISNCIDIISVSMDIVPVGIIIYFMDPGGAGSSCGSSNPAQGRGPNKRDQLLEEIVLLVRNEVNEFFSVEEENLCSRFPNHSDTIRDPIFRNSIVNLILSDIDCIYPLPSDLGVKKLRSIYENLNDLFDHNRRVSTTGLTRNNSIFAVVEKALQNRRGH